MNKEEELAHLRAPSPDPQQRMIDYWGRRAEKAEDENARLRAALKPFADYADPSAVFPPTVAITNGSRLARRQLTMGDCYEAARALEQSLDGRKE